MQTNNENGQGGERGRIAPRLERDLLGHGYYAVTEAIERALDGFGGRVLTDAERTAKQDGLWSLPRKPFPVERETAEADYNRGYFEVNTNA